MHFKKGWGFDNRVLLTILKPVSVSVDTLYLGQTFSAQPISQSCVIAERGSAIYDALNMFVVSVYP